MAKSQWKEAAQENLRRANQLQADNMALNRERRKLEVENALLRDLVLRAMTSGFDQESTHAD